MKKRKVCEIECVKEVKEMGYLIMHVITCVDS